MTIIEILDIYGVSYLREGNHHCRPGWVQMDCPQCGEGTGKFHLGLNVSGGYFSCWRCRKLPTVQTIADLTGQPPGKIKSLYDKGADLDRGEVLDVRGKLTLPKPLEDLKKIHRQYLRSRDFDPDELEQMWKLQGLGMSGRLRVEETKINLAYRIFIPIIYAGKTVSWTTRAIADHAKLRYISAPAKCEKINHKTLLYGEDAVPGDCVCAVEGPFDVWRGGPGFVGLSGTGYTQTQLGRLSKYYTRGVCFDNEPAAQRIAKDLVRELSAFPGKTYNIILDSKDPGSATQREINQIRRSLKL